MISVTTPHVKTWSIEQTMELLQLYKKYLPDFHTTGQRKMTVWQKVTEEMANKGYMSFSWAECSSKFRSLRDRLELGLCVWVGVCVRVCVCVCVCVCLCVCVCV
jgi:hypothetical protein